MNFCRIKVYLKRIFKKIFKNIENMSRTFQVLKQTFALQNIKEFFLKTILKNYDFI